MIKLKNILEFHHGKAPSAKDPKKDGNKRVFQGKGYRVTLKKDKNYTEKGVYQATYKDNPGLSKEKAKQIAARIHKNMKESVAPVIEKFDSKAQQRYMFATNPKAAKKLASKMTKKDYEELPDKVSKENVAPDHDGKAAPYGSGYEKVDEVRGGLGKWFREKWVDVSRKTKSGKHPKCGASAGKKSRAGGKRAYPKCVPASKASSMSKKDKASATRRKRAAYKSKKGAPSKKPKNVSTEHLQEIGRLIEKNNPTQPSKWAYAKAQAKKKFKVYPSAYANAWAAKKYKELGGGWRKGK